MLDIKSPVEFEKPYQVLDAEGKVVGPLPEGLSNDQMLKWYRTMLLTRALSVKLVALQRQGKATTWIPCQGQEAAAVGIATPLLPQDWLACSPREVGAYLLKGVPAKAIAYFVRGYATPPELFDGNVHCLPMTIVIGTQAPHAVGLAMAAKIRGDDAVVVGACGDGASSEGDFNESLNFAGVYQAPVVLVVINNGWSISVPRQHQTAARTIAQRGAGFGVPARLVDGNDILAMYAVMKEATERARSGGGPTLVEALTYRLAAHSTADDPTRYQPAEELALWQGRDPLKRYRRFLMERSLLGESEDAALHQEIEEELAEQIKVAYEYPVPGPDSFFNNVYQQPTSRLTQQRKDLQNFLAINELKSAED
jgi:pyruvate dehydrogenase E1 component alpha subunit